MKEKISNCSNLTICNRKDLLVDGIYIDKEVMAKRRRINCFKKKTCQDIIRLLDRGERKQAQDLLSK